MTFDNSTAIRHFHETAIFSTPTTEVPASISQTLVPASALFRRAIRHLPDWWQHR